MTHHYQKLFVLCALLLTSIGIVFVYSASTYWSSVHYAGQTPFYIKQIIYFAIACIVFVMIIKGPALTEKKLLMLYVFSLVLLILVLIPGIGIWRNGSRSWIGIGSLTIQPAELVKITTLLYLSARLAKVKSFERVVKLEHFVIIFLPALLIMLQPDFGSVFILVVTAFMLLFIAKYPIKLYIFLMLAGIAGLTALIISAPYRLKRIQSFLDPWSDSLGSGFQAVQSLMAIGPAGLFGHGFLQSRQKYLYLPEPQNDFIFSIILEEMGFVGGIVILVMFATLFYCGYALAIRAYSLKQFYMIGALITMLVLQTCLNIGVVIGLLPVTGVTLPFISYGGTSLIVIWITVALVIKIMNTKRKEE
ncbi:putative lipid II flippase FtsW [Metasolibacillus meyeri]|uniref:Lipid II flippase FtsW n=1 Tax=Metasolibacillus meyeri TaxID=1071052 RepID=A0AAW9NW13_9BACL|nr:putative lipid II flippase FtsW [Metasolibacillus meyeri]MEC1179446.1 putative lipid II flippase FtsW [Metasolibacillus meyeri]